MVAIIKDGLYIRLVASTVPFFCPLWGGGGGGNSVTIVTQREARRPLSCHNDVYHILLLGEEGGGEFLVWVVEVN